MPVFVADEIVTAAKLNLATARDWADWTPTLTNITLGNGTVVARFVQIGMTVHFRFQFTFGSSGSAMGSLPTISLPVTADTTFTGSRGYIGLVECNDAGLSYGGSVKLATATTANGSVWNAAGTFLVTNNITSTTPMTWANGDILAMTGTYEAI